jgi:hypothetical protein
MLMNDNYFVKTSLHYGALSGIGSFLFYLLLYFAGQNLFGPVTMLGIWIPVLFIVFAIRFYRNGYLGGYITFGRAFLLGVTTSLFGAALFGLSFYLFGIIYDPGLVESYKLMAEDSLEQGKALLSDSMYEKAMDSIELVTMGSLAFSEAFNKVLGGALISLVVALIMKRKSPESGSAPDQL